MSQNKEDLKNKIIYRASYRGTKEMDILMTAFVKSFIDELNEDTLKILDAFVNMDDETLISFKKKESLDNIKDKNLLDIIDRFKKFSWRRDWESNPGKSCPFAGFQDRCFQPLSHLSTPDIYI